MGMNLDEQRRYCLSKTPHDTRHAAKKHAKRARGAVGVYHCAICSKWHIGRADTIRPNRNFGSQVKLRKKLRRTPRS